jgi:hypothetical protein
MSDEVKQETAPAATPAADTGTAPAGPDLNLSDLSALRSIVEVASQRGAFKAAELESVGKVYNKLSNFLESVAKKEA